MLEENSQRIYSAFFARARSTEQIVRQMREEKNRQCWGFALRSPYRYCTYLVCEEHIFDGFAQTRTRNEPQLLCVSDIFIHSRIGIAYIILQIAPCPLRMAVCVCARASVLSAGRI